MVDGYKSFERARYLRRQGKIKFAKCDLIYCNKASDKIKKHTVRYFCPALARPTEAEFVLCGTGAERLSMVYPMLQGPPLPAISGRWRTGKWVLRLLQLLQIGFGFRQDGPLPQDIAEVLQMF
jgi:hypothetical protein